jgi:23S rRNA pseudouridine2457 synthase
LSQQYRYIITYKPDDVLCSRRDRYGRLTLDTLGIPEGVHPAGRLDLDSEGLLLLTDDGDFFHRITHPHFHHPKVYVVLVLGHPDDEALRRLREGVEIKYGLTRPADIEVLQSPPPLPPSPKPLPAPEKTSWLRIVLYEGKKRQIRRMTAAVEHPTLRLVRVAIGPLTLPADLQPGQWRDLTSTERKVLLNWVWPHGRPVKQHKTARVSPGKPRHGRTPPKKEGR